MYFKGLRALELQVFAAFKENIDKRYEQMLDLQERREEEREEWLERDKVLQMALG